MIALAGSAPKYRPSNAGGFGGASTVRMSEQPRDGGCR
jgi:hypothetical protein